MPDDGLNSGQCEVSDWEDIVAISAGYYHSAGLKADGTVVATGYNLDGQCEVSDWTDIVAISAGWGHTVGLKADGTVVASRIDSDCDYGQWDVSDWTDIVAVSAGCIHTVGLRADGTVVATGENADGQCDVSDWTDIVAINAGWYHTVGLKADGTMVSTGNNDSGQCNVNAWNWKDIRVIAAPSCYTDVGDTVVFGQYRRDTNSPVEDIEWLVLDKTDDSLLLISKYLLDFKPYHNTSGAVEWKDCSLRDWLNNDFYTAAFNPSEQAIILETELSGYTDSWDDEISATTIDNIFILSRDELSVYFHVPSDNSGSDSKYVNLIAYATPFYDITQSNAVSWWERTKVSSGRAYTCPYDGRIHSSGSETTQTCGVRPAILVKVS